ncbi:uncharacterized protein STEHIDRAFT_63546 [Stereum hirsutum FP-91666 SS1]|uniref:uncharacterized protein n=1 Tax=Stereum hirsutum (strain FP-91666) TaxID=721885 RepID=UPI00044497EA|nr:uncharacterized protein STEHIDRAFT_63546 [Stereum hirsutum FP-91666 SS1]EIM83605.1 hypothetical protein STEHIDRAFT_63546 [Stereum hirsutum FP-91666 SS1]
MSGPRWYTYLTKVLTEHDKSSRKSLYQIATIDSANRPHVRSQINRGFLTAPDLPAFPVLLTTTDSRSPKIEQLGHSNLVEICWWIDGSSDQFRILGRSRNILSTPTTPKDEDDCIALKALDAAHFDWEAKRHELFNAASSHMRASWCRPVPGSVLKGGYDEAKNWVESVKKEGEAETDEEKKFTAQALGNFALMAIEPLEVDWVQMGIVPNRRTKYWREGRCAPILGPSATRHTTPTGSLRNKW